jgi:hypothetical protein
MSNKNTKRNQQLLDDFSVKGMSLSVYKLPNGRGEVLYINKKGGSTTMQLSPDFLKTPFGVSAGLGQTVYSSNRLTLDVETTPEIESKINEIEEELQRLVKEKNLFGDSDMKFQSCIKQSKNPEYSNVIRTKLNKSDVSVGLQESGLPGNVQDIKGKSLVKLIFKLKSLWRKGDDYGPVLETQSVLVTYQKQSYSFY